MDDNGYRLGKHFTKTRCIAWQMDSDTHLEHIQLADLSYTLTSSLGETLWDFLIPILSPPFFLFLFQTFFLLLLLLFRLVHFVFFLSVRSCRECWNILTQSRRQENSTELLSTRWGLVVGWCFVFVWKKPKRMKRGKSWVRDCLFIDELTRAVCLVRNHLARWQPTAVVQVEIEMRRKLRVVPHVGLVGYVFGELVETLIASLKYYKGRLDLSKWQVFRGTDKTRRVIVLGACVICVNTTLNSCWLRINDG